MFTLIAYSYTKHVSSFDNLVLIYYLSWDCGVAVAAPTLWKILHSYIDQLIVLNYHAALYKTYLFIIVYPLQLTGIQQQLTGIPLYSSLAFRYIAHWHSVTAHWHSVKAHWHSDTAHWLSVTAHWHSVTAHWHSVTTH